MRLIDFSLGYKTEKQTLNLLAPTFELVPKKLASFFILIFTKNVKKDTKLCLYTNTIFLHLVINVYSILFIKI